ncbi:MAG: COG1361 S-layer family protein [Candidatus Woesearchaeota archaeon]
MKQTLFLVMLMLLAISVHAASSLDSSQVISISLVNQDPDPAIAGEIVEVRIGVENIGGQQATNLIVELVPDYPFTLIPGETAVRQIGTMNAYQKGESMKIIKYKVRSDKDTTAGSYELKVKYYEEGSVVATQKSLSVDVQSRESAEIIYIDQVELIPGKITPLKFTINNVGSAPLREISFQWENEDDIILPVGSDNTKYIKYLDVGGSAELKFDVIASANADPDLYKLDLKLTYADPITGEDKEIATKAGIYVGGATDFDVAFSGISSSEYTFSISNIGSVSASSVTVRIPVQQGWSVTGSNSVIIGNLNEGDYTIASFNLQQTGAQPGQGFTRVNMTRPAMENPKVNLEIIYTDSRGNRNTVEKEVAVDTSARAATAASATGTSAGFNPALGRQRQSTTQQIWNTAKWVLPLAILTLLVILGQRQYKKERLKNPAYTYKQLLADTVKKANKLRNRK